MPRGGVGLLALFGGVSTFIIGGIEDNSRAVIVGVLVLTFGAFCTAHWINKLFRGGK